MKKARLLVYTHDQRLGGNRQNENRFHGCEDSIKNSPKIPILGIASEEDREGAAAVNKVVDLSGNAYTLLQMFKDAGHAASISAKSTSGSMSR